MEQSNALLLCQRDNTTLAAVMACCFVCEGSWLGGFGVSVSEREIGLNPGEAIEFGGSFPRKNICPPTTLFSDPARWRYFLPRMPIVGEHLCASSRRVAVRVHPIEVSSRFRLRSNSMGPPLTAISSSRASRKTYILSLTVPNISSVIPTLTRMGYGADIFELRVDLLTAPNAPVGQTNLPPK